MLFSIALTTFTKSSLRRAAIAGESALEYLTMNDLLTEQQMREALFGPSSPTTLTETDDASELQFVPSKRTVSKSTTKQATSTSLFPKLRVTLQVGKTFEGEVESLVHDARTLSTLLAEQEARELAKKKKYKYIEVVSITRV